MRNKINRRSFIQAAAYAGATLPWAAPRLVRAQSANNKLNLAFIGTANQARFSISNTTSENFIAFADVDQLLLDKALADYPQSRGYRDYRVMLDKEQNNIDAFVVATPDHHHAHAALRGMAMGKHCYCEKPLAHSVQEVRLMTDIARRNGLATQMGTQIHAGDNYRRVVEAVRSGAIGKISEVHAWLFGGTYHGGRFAEQPDPVPPHLDWDLWLGPAEQRDYYDKLYHTFNWRGWWDFGGGGTTDFGCHWVDLPHWALGLMQPHTIKASSTAEPLPLRTTRALMNEMHHTVPDSPAPLASPEGHVKVTWHVGGTHMDMIDVYQQYGIDPKAETNRGSKILFVGNQGLLLADYGTYHLLPADKFTDYQPPEPFIENSVGHHAEWIRACKEGTPTTCNFAYSGALTEAILLGVVSHRSGNAELKYDASTMRITNNTDANSRLGKAYRKGWDIDQLA